eukprot:GHVU01158291.1.p1 GENE.GHVU01158291.1~~GHVU01158291.1.p1  ORF type:complete len:103 (-),score=11.34 GHVU01158291.1:18-326(-)
MGNMEGYYSSGEMVSRWLARFPVGEEERSGENYRETPDRPLMPAVNGKDEIGSARVEDPRVMQPADGPDGLPRGVAAQGTPHDIFTSTTVAPEEVREHPGMV